MFYINLDSRPDRKQSIEKELSCLGTPERFSAVVAPQSLGCAMSHIAVLKLAMERDLTSYMIFEDDFVFTRKVDKLVLPQKWDVILLSAVIIRHQPCTDNLVRVYEASTTTAYMVNSEYYNILLQNFTEG